MIGHDDRQIPRSPFNYSDCQRCVNPCKPQICCSCEYSDSRYHPDFVEGDAMDKIRTDLDDVAQNLYRFKHELIAMGKSEKEQKDLIARKVQGYRLSPPQLIKLMKVYKKLLTEADVPVSFTDEDFQGVNQHVTVVKKA